MPQPRHWHTCNTSRVNTGRIWQCNYSTNPVNRIPVNRISGLSKHIYSLIPTFFRPQIRVISSPNIMVTNRSMHPLSRLPQYTQLVVIYRKMTPRYVNCNWKINQADACCTRVCVRVIDMQLSGVAIVRSCPASYYEWHQVFKFVVSLRG